MIRIFKEFIDSFHHGIGSPEYQHEGNRNKEGTNGENNIEDILGLHRSESNELNTIFLRVDLLFLE